jgi:hypothetical protein
MITLPTDNVIARASTGNDFAGTACQGHPALIALLNFQL